MDERITIINEGEFGSRPDWDEYFMNIAVGVSRRSSCYKVNAGSVFVKDKRLVGTGYNGAPSCVESCLEKGGCYKEIKTGESYSDTMNSGLCRGVHGEMNALAHLTQMVDRSELSLYTTIFPCNSCAKGVSGIKKLVFKSGYDGREFESALNLFLERGTEVFQLDMSPMRKWDLNFNSPNVVHGIWSDEDLRQINEMKKGLSGLLGK